MMTSKRRGLISPVFIVNCISKCSLIRILRRFIEIKLACGKTENIYYIYNILYEIRDGRNTVTF